jgi:CheY-like chemotaxis protein
MLKDQHHDFGVAKALAFSLMTPKTWKVPCANKRRVLLVDGDNEAAAALKEFLEPYSCQVTRVTNAVEGLEKVMCTEFDVILCDIVTPTFPADKFFIAVERIDPRFCERFIFMTGHKADPKWDAFIRSVRGLVLWKPFQMHELLTAIQTVLRRSLKRELSDYDRPMPGNLGTSREGTEPGLWCPPRQTQPNGHFRDFRQSFGVSALDSNLRYPP